MTRATRRTVHFPLPSPIRLMRPANMSLCAVSVLTGGLVSGKPLAVATRLLSDPLSPPAIRLLSAIVSAAFILAAGNIFNDIMDIQTDRINRPGRPLAAGTVSIRSASVATLLLAAAGFGCSLVLGLQGAAVAGPAILLLILYNRRLKGIPLAGNLAVALLGGLAVLFGGLAMDSPVRSLLPAGYAVLLHLGRELVKDAEDVHGDAAAGIRTMATVRGLQAAGIGAFVALAGLIGVVMAPALTGYFGTVYTIVVSVGVLPVTAYAGISALFVTDPGSCGRLSFLLKIVMPIGIVAVLAGFQLQ